MGGRLRRQGRQGRQQQLPPTPRLNGDTLGLVSRQERARVGCYFDCGMAATTLPAVPVSHLLAPIGLLAAVGAHSHYYLLNKCPAVGPLKESALSESSGDVRKRTHLLAFGCRRADVRGTELSLRRCSEHCMVPAVGPGALQSPPVTGRRSGSVHVVRPCRVSTHTSLPAAAAWGVPGPGPGHSRSPRAAAATTPLVALLPWRSSSPVAAAQTALQRTPRILRSRTDDQEEPAPAPASGEQQEEQRSPVAGLLRVLQPWDHRCGSRDSVGRPMGRGRGWAPLGRPGGWGGMHAGEPGGGAGRHADLTL